MSEKVRLKANDPEDLAVIAAFLQDARICLKEMMFSPDERRFMGAFTRYRRERLKDWSSCEGLTECLAAVVFDEIAEVKYRGLDTAHQDKELVPFPERVNANFNAWLTEQEKTKKFTTEQRHWLERC